MKNFPQIAEYVWLSNKGIIRSKTKILPEAIKQVTDLPIWNFDGSSTEQASGHFSDVTLKPVRIYKDPFRKQNHILVLCECFNDLAKNEINSKNTRALLRQSLEGKENEEIYAGIEQEYVLYDTKTKLPYKWDSHQEPGAGPQGPYYCAIGGNKIYGREIVEEHMMKCLEADLLFHGINAEVMPSQWEFQIGTGDALKVADDLWVGRYVLERITENYGAYVNYHPKPHIGDWNGSGGHVNFSSKKMREEGGLKEIERAIHKLEKRHKHDINLYGEENNKRLTGLYETQSINKFSWGIGDRGSSIRINKSVAEKGKGYFEDRRPASNLDPYVVLSAIINSIYH